MQHRSISTKRIVLASLMAALTVAGSYIRITVPLQVSGFASFHLGNILCALSGILLGPWLGALAAGLGSAVFDLLHPLFISEAWLTFLTKGIYGLVAGLVIRIGGRKWGYPRALGAAAASAVTYAAVYLFKSYLYNGILLSGLSREAAALSLVGLIVPTVCNAAVAIVFAPLLAVSIRNALRRSHLYVDEI